MTVYDRRETFFPFFSQHDSVGVLKAVHMALEAAGVEQLEVQALVDDVRSPLRRVMLEARALECGTTIQRLVR